MSAPFEASSAPPVDTGHGWRYRARVDHWTDGDTVVVDCLVDVGFEEMVTKRRRVRLLGVNTPETRGSAPAERQAGLLAKAEAERLAPPRSVVDVLIVKWDKYGGRDDGTITHGDLDVAEQLLAGGYGDPYDGGPR